MYYIGIDLGSTATKVTVLNDESLFNNFSLPTGWSSKETSRSIEKKLTDGGVDFNKTKIIATGFGRNSVNFADRTIPETSCHGYGALFFTKENCNVIDIGGQDTKIIKMIDGNAVKCTLNNKCAAGTGRFLELMANTLGVDIQELCQMAQWGNKLTIRSMCTVFAEAEVMNLIEEGNSRQDVAYGIIDLITNKVKTLCTNQVNDKFDYFLTGGLCQNKYLISRLSEKLGKNVRSHPLARYAGSIGAALYAKKSEEKNCYMYSSEDSVAMDKVLVEC